MSQLIDFSKFLNGSPSQKLSTAQAILRGFQTAGFIYLSNIPIAPSVVSQVFSYSATFFKLSMSEKLSIAWTTPEANRGYSAPGREKATILTDEAAVDALRKSVPDIKESIEIGREDEPEHPNRWPVETEENNLVGFRDLMLSFFDQCASLHKQIMRAIAVGIGIDEEYFDAFVCDNDNTLRLLHYPSVPKKVFDESPSQVRAGEHTDYGSITLLFQDQSGGLQVKSSNGQFIDATPIEGTCVVNGGDLLARWSNDTIKSTLHRVVRPPGGMVKGEDGEECFPARYSVA